ncbi:peptidase [Thermopolyspora flexuosa]|uniref:ClpA/ClpB-like protein n=1 Tax=Thermopolyspora flexuosa TaxID=103836 RepID=A0A543J1Q8_9ACTN|nr:Clp protease N-terminal domain-containing protein [Thermopolyspora flexuosa]TQM76755.1 ClpA/ClpB-like protein [Thermopolyspora flexuosa]GGM86520.1 peptidase [Thermopolyspora flexuosa]
MFRGDDPDLSRTIGRAWVLARDLGHPRVGAEHLLLALAVGGGTVAELLGAHGATEDAIRAAARAAEPADAGAAADREMLARLGVDLDRMLGEAGTALLDRPPAREPLLPLGAARARRRCARMNPPIGLDAQAAYEASLRLALARRERWHRREHLALALVAFDAGTAWVLNRAGAEPETVLAALAAAFPPPRRNVVLRLDRRLGRRSRLADLVRRYQRTTGRTVTAGPAAVMPLVC